MGKYLEDRELNSVLENYFEEDNYAIELSKNDNYISEGLISSINAHIGERRKKAQEKLLNKFKEAIKNNKYKYYAVTATCIYVNGAYDHTTFILYGSNVRPFTKADKGFIRAWKKDMQAKRLMTHLGMYMEKMSEIPPEVRKYII